MYSPKLPELSRKQYGHLAYRAYCKEAGGVSLISGEKLPEYKDLSEKIQNAWIAAAIAVSMFVDHYKKDPWSTVEVVNKALPE